MRTRTIIGGLGTLVLTAALTVAAPLAASAHVTIDPGRADAGGWTYLTFRMPTESDTAATTKLQIHLPADTPLTHVSYQPTPGWTTQVTEKTLPEPVNVAGNTVPEAPTEITYTAADGGAKPGQVQTFLVSVGPVPDTGHIVIPATQTYSDGTVVEWEATPEQMTEDDTLSPAPVLWINDRPPEEQTEAAEAALGPEPSPSVTLGLSLAGLVLGTAGAVLGALAFAHSRRSAK
ncbi:YcnI family protein [Brevibacterium aurantiacum]|uniref:YcnI family protein n=1 Tax=Brevibacterium aurantiacum TaxID=273384 RepID=A0A556CBR9_BREAU|nr:YcnI family protein [Brevibacterium aurantiacum]TSI14488.1 YcnI family protein [Brevibacterium aurantiacum]